MPEQDVMGHAIFCLLVGREEILRNQSLPQKGRSSKIVMLDWLCLGHEYTIIVHEVTRDSVPADIN
jgi:hypothetical protein